MVSAAIMDEKGEAKGCKRRRRVMGPFKGVRMRKWGKWVSEIRVPRTNARIWLGSYDTPEKAARAYDAAVYCLQGLKGNFNFPGDERLGISGGSFSVRLKEEIQEIAARFASGGCMSLPPSASSAPYINSPQMLVTTPSNSSDMVITTPIHSPERLATTLMNSQEVLITTFMKQPHVLVRTFIRPPEVPLTNFMEPPQVPVTVFINPSQVPITTSVKLSEIPVPPKMLVTTSMNPPEVPVPPQMLVTTSMNLPEVRVSPEVMTPSLDPQLVSIKVDDIGHTCEGSYSHLANISEPDGFSPDSFLLDEPFDPDSTSSISDEAKGDMK